ncbi:MAG: capping complex subunit for YIEGIA [Bacillota bacterium]
MTGYSNILAVVTSDMSLVSGGGAPVFRGADEKECERIAGSLSRILDASAHRLENDVFIIVYH